MPEATVSEKAGELVFAVLSVGCAAAGAVTHQVSGGTATPEVDFVLSDGWLQWAAGDATPRVIVAQIVDDLASEAGLEDFTVTLSGQSASIQVAHRPDQCQKRWPPNPLWRHTFCTGGFLDLFVKFARRSDAVIYTEEGAAMLTRPDQRACLPNELQHRVFLVSDGKDLEAAIARIP